MTDLVPTDTTSSLGGRAVSCSPFLKNWFRAIPGKADGADHWVGGEPLYNGATCLNCGIPLLLLWDINCLDNRFPRGKFGHMSRLPLFFCWGCCGDLSYQVASAKRVKVFRNDYRLEGPNPPYRNYPRAFD